MSKKTKVYVRVLPTERDTQNHWHVDGKKIISVDNPNDKFSFGKLPYIHYSAKGFTLF